MQKYLFLVGVRQERPSYEFVPHKYGCFSFQAEADRRTMIKYGWLKNADRWAVAAATDHDGSLSGEDVAALREVKRVYGGLSRRALLKRIYMEHPLYAINSEVLDDVLDRTTAEAVRRTRPKRRGRKLFTLGYEGIPLERFLRALVIHDIRVLCDVRRNPLSMKYGFSKTQLSCACDAIGVRYVHLPELGIPSSRRRGLDTPAEYVRLFDEYERTTLQSSPESLLAIQDLVVTNKRIVLVCFEACHEDCHRSRLAEALRGLHGWDTPIRHALRVTGTGTSLGSRCAYGKPGPNRAPELMAEPQVKSDPVESPLPMLPRIVKVDANPEDHTIVATFASGEKRRFDVTPLLEKGVFKRIQDADAFVSVDVDEMGGVVWEAGPDLSRDTVYLGGDPVSLPDETNDDGR